MARPKKHVDSPGRRSVITDEVIAAAADGIEKGLTQRLVAAELGVHQNTIGSWVLRGERDIEAGNDQTLYARFAARVNLARATRARRLIAKIEAYCDVADPKTGRRDARTLLDLLGRLDRDYSPMYDVRKEVRIDDSRTAREQLTAVLTRVAARSREIEASERALGDGAAGSALVAGDGATGATLPVVTLEGGERPG